MVYQKIIYVACSFRLMEKLSQLDTDHQNMINQSNIPVQGQIQGLYLYGLRAVRQIDSLVLGRAVVLSVLLVLL
jgi:hypothetical protein